MLSHIQQQEAWQDTDAFSMGSVKKNSSPKNEIYLAIDSSSKAVWLSSLILLRIFFFHSFPPIK